MISLTALRDESGELKGFAKITRDLTERKESEDTLRDADLKFNLLMTACRSTRSS